MHYKVLWLSSLRRKKKHLRNIREFNRIGEMTFFVGTFLNMCQKRRENGAEKQSIIENGNGFRISKEDEYKWDVWEVVKNRHYSGVIKGNETL